ncbi:MAG: hypothetical protein E5V25_28880, partial [Mesorhizobium sp.]
MSALKIASVILSDTGIVTKIIAIGHPRPLAVPKDWHKRYAGTDTDKGYFVLYDGGYASWSPSKEFEDGYTLMQNAGYQGDDDLTFKSPLDVAELARGVGAAARFFANGGG